TRRRPRRALDGKLGDERVDLVLDVVRFGGPDVARRAATVQPGFRLGGGGGAGAAGRHSHERRGGTQPPPPTHLPAGVLFVAYWRLENYIHLYVGSPGSSMRVM